MEHYEIRKRCISDMTVNNPVASLRMVTPGAEFRGVTLHNVYQSAKGYI